jgi:hypothetical protein
VGSRNSHRDGQGLDRCEQVLHEGFPANADALIGGAVNTVQKLTDGYRTDRAVVVADRTLE